MTVTEQSGGFAPVAADLVKIPSGNENNRCRTIGDLGTIGDFKRRSDAWIFIRNLRCAIEGEISITHLRKRIQLGVRIIFPCDQRQICLGSAVFLDVNLRDPTEQFREHEIAVLRFFIVIIGSSAEHIRSIKRRHRLLLFRAAADYHNEKPEYGDFMFPKLFGRIAQIYIDKYGATEADLALVAWKNYAHAKLNPMAQMRDADLTLDCASQVSDKNPSVAPPLKVSDCSQITDGAASALLVSGRYLDKIGRDRSKTARLLGYGHTTDYLPLDKKDAPTFSVARKAAEKAFRMANLTPRDLQGAEVHDCFSITEIVAYEILGLAEPGKGVELVKSGATALPQVR